MKVSEMLLKGANFLKNNYWVRGTRYATMNGTPTNMNSACRFCSIGAMDKACGVNDVKIVRRRAPDISDLITFNDFYAKNKMEVVDRMREMAKKYKSKGD